VMDHNKNDLSPKEHREFRNYMEKGIRESCEPHIFFKYAS